MITLKEAMVKIFQDELLPVAILHFDALPSMNDIPLNRFKKSEFTQHYKQIARVVGLEWLSNNQNDIQELPLIKKHAVVVAHIYFGNLITRDYHNIYFKPILDGLTTANFWPDDMVVTSLSPLCYFERNKPRVELWLYDLSDLVVHPTLAARTSGKIKANNNNQQQKQPSIKLLKQPVVKKKNTTTKTTSKKRGAA